MRARKVYDPLATYLKDLDEHIERLKGPEITVSDLRLRAEPGEEAFWTTVHEEMIKAFGRAFGRKFIPETFEQGRDFLVGQADWDAIVKAVQVAHDFCEHLSDVVEEIIEGGRVC